MTLVGKAGREVAPLRNLRVDGKLQAPGILLSTWLAPGVEVWVRLERMRVAHLRDGVATFDGMLDTRIHRAHRKPVKGAARHVVDKLAPDEPVAEQLGVVHLRSLPCPPS